ncbi:phage holin family protein [Phenylobacterium sp. J426]|uniref:phage holin family protein n=1 Tax=Phenylobacterium sp. J426 TaxID=2898439 RepID=UPI00215149C6|nr:phage holin family protein [Phenylobacterium sp. J426]MCR5875094.1 phage holin family protein [Phenylobacterium sp. J426]
MRTDARTLPELVSQLTTDLATLVRKESELVRTEMTEKLHTAGKAAGEIVAGGVFVLAALGVLLAALVAALSEYMHPAFAALIVGVAVAAVGVVLIRAGLKMLKPENLKPDRTARQLQKDAQLVKGK